MYDSILFWLNKATKEHPANRYELAKRYGINERQVRMFIQAMRNDGIRVCSNSSGRGYWIAKTTAEYERFRAEYGSRATKIFKTIKAMDGATEGQMQW
jgi:predicted ArsR family transcriptional regulator